MRIQPNIIINLDIYFPQSRLDGLGIVSEALWHSLHFSIAPLFPETICYLGSGRYVECTKYTTTDYVGVIP